MMANGDAPIYTVRGERVALGPPRRDQIDLWLRWYNDLEVTRTLGASRVITREMEERFYEEATQEKQQGKAVSFAIYELETGRPIGTCSLREIDHQNGTATFGIAIGEKECWNRGYGTEATRLTLDYAFHALGLHNVLLQVYANNLRGARAYEKAGFRVIGRRRGARRLGQRRMDVILMDAVADDFTSPVLERLLHAPQEPPDGGTSAGPASAPAREDGAQRDATR